MKDSERIARIIAKSGGFAAAGTVLGTVFEYLSRLIIARHLGASGYGLISIGASVLTVISSIALFGLGAGVTRFVSYYRGRGELSRVKGTISSGLQMVALLGVVLGLLTFILSRQIAVAFFKEPLLITPLKVFAIGIPFLSLLGFSVAVFRGFKKIAYMVYSKQVFEVGTRMVLIGLFVLLGFRLLGISVAYLISLGVACVLSAYLLKRTFREQKGWKTTDRAAVGKQLLAFSLPLGAGQVLNRVRNKADTLILGYFLGAYQVGLFNAALPVARLLQLGLNSLNRLFMPSVSELYAEGRVEELQETYRRVAKWSFCATLPAFLVFVAFSRLVIRGLFGAEFQQASLSLVVISLGVLGNVSTGSFGETLIAIGKTRINMVLSLVLIAINVVLSVLLIPRIGILGAAIANSVSLVVTSLAGLVFLYMHMGIQPFTLDHLKFIASASLSFGLLYSIIMVVPGPPSPWLLIPFLFMLYGLSFLGLYLFRGLDEVERRILRDTLRKLKR